MSTTMNKTSARVYRLGPASVILRPRTLLVCSLLAVAIAAILLGTVGSGYLGIAPLRVIDVLLGGGTHLERHAVLQLRLPRVLLALLAGAGLALSGAIFQSLTRNPLGSPDVMGFTSGAYAGVVVSILLLGGGREAVQAGAIVGGLATAGIVYALAYRRGVQGFRLIIVGIALSMVLSAATTWLMLRARVDIAMSAAIWGTGSLNGATWADVAQVAVALAVLLPAVVLGSWVLRAMSLGDDLAAGLGVRLRWAMLGLTVLGVALSASVVAVTGLILFIALAAPQLARQLVGGASVPFAATALLGAALLSASDWIAQFGLPERQLPVGVVTVCLGGGFLVWLLIKEARRT
ncbi:iron complex transport system permease protein [Agreia bicolorata]|uniref:Iron complex transport system permease protein n=1 Tax=Agreia bicolorata TaxID=110935 RepID=A0A1T4Y9B2_9MICO|nr:iron chelate uptake ABC transporter family permease subunit [Agreia bicolorata]SKA98434.1 iron complex transport system permease protein [Agreia bicolorata]